MLRDPNSYTRAAAANALGRFGTQAEYSIPELIRALDDDSEDVASAAASALGYIGIDTQGTSSALGIALGRPESMVQREAERALRGLGTEEALEILRAAGLTP